MLYPIADCVVPKTSNLAPSISQTQHVGLVRIVKLLQIRPPSTRIFVLFIYMFGNLLASEKVVMFFFCNTAVVLNRWLVGVSPSIIWLGICRVHGSSHICIILLSRSNARGPATETSEWLPSTVIIGNNAGGTLQRLHPSTGSQRCYMHNHCGRSQA